MSVTPYSPGQTLTASMLAFPRRFETQPAGGSDGTETAIAEITVPAQPIPTIQVPAANVFLQPNNQSAASSRWYIRATDDENQAWGTSEWRNPQGDGTTTVMPLPIAAARGKPTPAGQAVTWQLTLQARVHLGGTAT